MSGAGPQKRSWTAEDEQRLRGLFKIDGRATKPHVNTPAGPYVIGSVLEPRPNARAGQADQRCRHCGEAKLVRKTFPRPLGDASVESLEGPWCFGCGRGA